MSSVAVDAYAPKLSPETVNKEPPLGAMFRKEYDSTAAS
jgi:hypothetical protein